MADQHLERARRSISHAVAAEGGGKSFQPTLYVADGARGALDPAFDAHVRPIHMWALAHWQGWRTPSQLHDAFCEAKGRVLSGTKTLWSKVAGPAAAVVASARRIGWNFLSGSQVECDDGLVLDLLLDPPVVVKNEVRRAVRRWRLNNIGKLHQASATNDSAGV